MKQTATTNEAACLLGIDPKNLARWASRHGVKPLRRQRIGRSTITIWSIAALKAAAAPERGQR